MRKRLMSILLCLVMLFSLVPGAGVTASAAEPEWTTVNTYDELKSELSSVFSSSNIRLGKDIDYTIGYEDYGIDVWKSQTLDLNGHKIRIDASKRAEFFNLITINHCEFTLCDSQDGGEIEVEFARDSKGHSIIAISPDEKETTKFTMNGGTLTRLNPIESSAYGDNGCISDKYFAEFNKDRKRPQITINGGTINCAYNWDRSKYKYTSSAKLNSVEAMPTALLLRYSNLTVNGGTINGLVWTGDLSWRKGDTEPRVSLNGGEFNFPFAVKGLRENVTQMVINGARFNDGFYVAESAITSSYEGNDPAMLIKSGVFDASGKNLKLDIYHVTRVGGYSLQVKQKATERVMKYFPNSAIKLNGEIYASENIGSRVIYDNNPYGGHYYLDLNLEGPIQIIPNAWGIKSVTLDGQPINYAKDWQSAVERMDNSTAHTLKFEWKPLAQELKDAGYSYRIKCEHYISGSTAVQKTENIDANATSHTVTIPADADPKIYSFDLHLNLRKGGSTVGIVSNEHIVKLVVNPAPVVTEISSAPIQLSAALTPGTSTPGATAVSSGYTVDSINWYTDSECTTEASSFGRAHV